MNHSKCERFILKARLLNNKLKQNLTKDISSQNSIDTLDQESIDYKSQNLKLSLRISEMEALLKNAYFHVEGEELRLKILIADSSAVTRAKLKKLFSNDIYEVFLPRDKDEAEKMITNNIIDLAIVEYGAKDSYGIELLLELREQEGVHRPSILLSTFLEQATLPLSHFQIISGIFHKPWVEKELLEKVEGILKNKVQN